MGQIDTSALVALRESASRAVLAADWFWLAEVRVDDSDDDQETTVKEVSPETRSQIAADITEVLSDPENMHTTSRKKYIEWARERPENAMHFLQTLCVIIQTLFVMLSFAMETWQGHTVKDAHVYEEPTSTSSVVYNLTVENNVTVIGDVPYYYEIEFAHPETGEMVTGYIYKGNVAAEESEETEAQVEETMAVEESEPIPDVTAAQTEPTE